MITSYPLLNTHVEKHHTLKGARRKSLSAQASETWHLMMKVTLPVSKSVTPLRNSVDKTFLAHLIELGHECLYGREAVKAARSDCFADSAGSPDTLITSQIHLVSELLSGKSDTSWVCIGWVPVWWLNGNNSTSLPIAAPSWRSLRPSHCYEATLRLC